MSEDHRTKRIVVRFTEDDLAWLNEQAEDEGVEPATLVRMIVARLRKGRAPLVSMMSAAPTAPRMVQRADIADLFEDDGRTLKSLKALPREISDAIESIEWVEDGTDESGKTRYRPKVKLFDKNAANFTLLKHFGGLPDPTPPAPKTNNILNVLSIDDQQILLGLIEAVGRGAQATGGGDPIERRDG
jgi:hypothetical protein